MLLSWRFLVGSVLESAISIILMTLVWEKNTIGQTIVLISPTDNFGIIPSLLMCPASSIVFAKLEGKFLNVLCINECFGTILPHIFDFFCFNFFDYF